MLKRKIPAKRRITFTHGKLQIVVTCFTNAVLGFEAPQCVAIDAGDKTERSKRAFKKTL